MFALLLFSQAAADEHASLSAVTITRTELDATGRRLDVTWNDGEQTSYPYIWLRDNCQCSVCFHASAMTRRLLFHDVDFNVMPQNVEVLSSHAAARHSDADSCYTYSTYGWWNMNKKLSYRLENTASAAFISFLHSATVKNLAF